jgi:hypothetical protein
MMIKKYFHTFIFIITCIMILSTCPGCNESEYYSLNCSLQYFAEEQPGWSVPACIQIWLEFNGYCDPGSTVAYASQQEIADYIAGLSGDLLENTKAAVDNYTDDTGKVVSYYNDASGLNKCIEWFNGCLDDNYPAIIPFDAGDYSVILYSMKYHYDRDIWGNKSNFEFRYIKVHDPVHGADQEHTRTSLETNFLPIDDLFQFVSGIEAPPWTFDGYLEFLKRCGTYYGGPEIYIPEGSIFLRVRYPQGNELAHGESDQIIWESNGMTGQIKLELYKNDTFKGTIAENLLIDNGSYTWTVGEYQGGSVQPCDDYNIKVSRMDDSFDDFSNTNFAMGSVKVASPNGGEAWEEGSLKNITWNNSYFTGNVKILLRKTIGATDYLIAEDVANTGVYQWEVGFCSHLSFPAGFINPEDNCFKIKVISMDNEALMDSSNDTFSIIEPGPPGITVTAPNGGESIVRGLPYEITWIGTGIVGNVKIELSKDNGATYPYLLVDSTANDGSYSYNIPETGGLNTNCLIRISETDGYPIDVSDAVFTLLPPSITVLNPNGGESIAGGTTIEITWTGVGNIENVKIEFSKNNGGTWQTIIESTENTGIYGYTIPIPGEQKDNCLIRISDTDGDPVDVSDAVFTVTVPGS